MGPEAGQRKGPREGCKGSGAAGSPARPSQLEEGVQAGMRKLSVPRPGEKPRNLSMRLSQEAPQPKRIPVPARSPGPGISVAPPSRPPHRDSPSGRRRGFASGAEPELESTPQRARAERALRACPRGRDGPPASPPRDSVLSRLRRPRPAPASCAQSGRGAALSSTGPRRPLLASVRRSPPGCPSVPRRLSARARTVPCGRSATFLHSGASTQGPLRPLQAGRASGAGTWQYSFLGRAANHIGPA